MKAAYLTLSISRRAAGMLDCVRRPAQELHQTRGVEVEVFSVTDDHTEADQIAWSPLPLRLFPSVGLTNLAFAPALAARLENSSPDLAHTFGLWTYLSRITHAWSRRTGNPYLVTPQGMLDPWAVNNSRWRKRLVGALYEYRHLRDAACLHATSLAELATFRAFGLRNPICVIPNGVDLPPDSAPTAPTAPWRDAVPRDQRVLLYLSRLHPKKGLVNLLRAWETVQKQIPQSAREWTLVVAGWDQGSHRAELEREVEALGIRSSVVFPGPLYGADKTAAYQHADAFVLPSLSEGLPLVVLEAWSHRLPVLLTTACNLPEGAAAGAALESGPAPGALALNLARLLNASTTERTLMGERGRALVENHFTWTSAAARLAQVYRWVKGDAERPDFVFV